MAEPLQALLAIAAVSLAGGVLFWPERGYFWRWRYLRKMGERILLEDALKHLYNCEYRRQTLTVESLAGALGLTGNRAAELLARLGALRLLKSAEGGLHLTAAGRDYALRIIRVHRLWEYYLAEKTGLAEVDWHPAAEHREHELSPAETDRLAEQMGHPLYDPHGDPIPTSSGDIAPVRGQPLTTLPTGSVATVIHVEDEPAGVYAQLVEAGVQLGMRLEVMEISPEYIRFLADGEEHVLSLVVAASIYAVPLPQEQEMKGPYETLAALLPREKGRVVHLSPGCRGLERRRLLDLGIVPGTVVEAEMKSPSGDPTAYRIRGALIALRKEQAEQIQITRQMEAV
jgi:DtxR family Mn-dependent transcriptional regulator